MQLSRSSSRPRCLRGAGKHRREAGVIRGGVKCSITLTEALLDIRGKKCTVRPKKEGAAGKAQRKDCLCVWAWLPRRQSPSPRGPGLLQPSPASATLHRVADSPALAYICGGQQRRSHLYKVFRREPKLYGKANTSICIFCGTHEISSPFLSEYW